MFVFTIMTIRLSQCCFVERIHPHPVRLKPYQPTRFELALHHFIFVYLPCILHHSNFVERRNKKKIGVTHFRLAILKGFEIGNCSLQ